MMSLIDYTEQLIAKLQGVLAAFRSQAERAELLPMFTRWDGQLEQMREYAAANETVSIAFVGGTGAGKSTLLNALLAADLLPTHSFRTCTSAAIAVSYANRKTLQATIEFLPESAWEEEKNRFLEEVKTAGESGHSSFVHQDFLYKAWSLYRPRKGQPPMPFPLEQLLELLKEPLPASLSEQLAHGELVLKDKTPEALKQQLTRFLTAESPIWPLIRRVSISGPFEVLRDGLELIDLPGLNDPNPVREQIARDCLRKAEFIWLIFGTGRGLTREVVDLMKDQGFLNQIVLDGKVSALAFIGTRADDFVPELERRALALPEEADLEQIRSLREDMIRQQIQQQLSELTLWFGNRYKVSAQSSDILNLIARTLQQSPVFLTSALSHLVQLGWLPENSTRFNQPQQSGVPQLHDYMQEIVAEHGLKARKKLIRSQFQQMNQEIRRLLETLRHRQALRELDPAQQAALRLSQLQQEQLKALNDIEAELKDSLRLKQIQFEKQWLYAFSDLQHRLEPLSERWQELNWQYLQRAVRDKGRYSSPRTGLSVDLTRDVLGFFETEVALDWYDFFQHRLLKVTDQAQALVSGLLEQSGQRAVELTAAHPELSARLESLTQHGLSILSEQTFRSRRKLESLIRDIQRRIALMLESNLRTELEPLFSQAGALSGTGVKGQIISALESGLQQALPEISSRCRPELTEMLAELSAGIETHQASLSGILREQLELICTPVNA